MGAILCEKMTVCDRLSQNKIHSDTIAYLFTVTLIRTYENHRRQSSPGGNITRLLEHCVLLGRYVVHFV